MRERKRQFLEIGSQLVIRGSFLTSHQGMAPLAAINMVLQKLEGRQTMIYPESHAKLTT